VGDAADVEGTGDSVEAAPLVKRARYSLTVSAKDDTDCPGAVPAAAPGALLNKDNQVSPAAADDGPG
jgi:hypothetical protein